jgi:predicted dehydrogenase
VGRVHLEALRRVEFVDVAAIAGRELASAKRLGAGFGVETVVDDYRKLLEDATIDAIHICTPNATHYQMAKNALSAGKHVLCEKPLSVSVEEAQELVTLAQERSLRNCLCHNLWYYPMVQQIRRMREDGDLGEVLVVQGTYSQDWLLSDTDVSTRWRERHCARWETSARTGSIWRNTSQGCKFALSAPTCRPFTQPASGRSKASKHLVESYSPP